MELRDLRTFAAVARLLSFHRAAAELNAAQSTVSARIAALETELGVRLFERLGRRVALTEAGERLVQYAAKLIDVEDEARAWVTGESRLRGLLTVRVPESLCAYRLPPVIAAFRRRHPEVALHLTACTLNGLEKDLRQGITDLAFVMADSVRGGDLNVEALGVEPLVLVAAPHHPLATRERVTARDLHGVTLVLSTADCAYRLVIEEALAAEGVQPAAGLEFSSAAALRGCVSSGVGITLLPLTAVRDELRAGVLRALPWADQPFETAVLMVRHRGKWVSPYMDTFMELCRATCAEAAGTARQAEITWDFPCPMADVATIVQPPTPSLDARPQPDTASQTLAPDDQAAPNAPATPGVPDAPVVAAAVDTLKTPDAPAAANAEDVPHAPLLPDTSNAEPDDMTPGLIPDMTQGVAPNMTPGMVPDGLDAWHDMPLVAEPEMWPDAHEQDQLADHPEALLNDPGPDPVPDFWTESAPDSLTDSWAASWPTTSPTTSPTSWPDGGNMDDADTGPETVWGAPQDMDPEVDAEMTSEALTGLPRNDPDDANHMDDADDFDAVAPTDAQYADGDDAPGYSVDDESANGVGMPLYDQKTEAPSGADPGRTTRAATPAASLHPEPRQPSLWDMPEPSGPPPVLAVSPPETVGPELSDTSTIPTELAATIAPTESVAAAESAGDLEQSRQPAPSDPIEYSDQDAQGQVFHPAESNAQGAKPDEAREGEEPDEAHQPDEGDPGDERDTGEQDAPQQAPARPAAPERTPAPAPEPATEAPQWLSLLPPRR